MISSSSYINSQYYNKYSKYFKNQKSINKINSNSDINNFKDKFQNDYNYNNTLLSQKDNKKKQGKFNFDHITILGMNLFSDDILLILIIYFLYTEGIKDVYLFIVLILLLLS